MPTPSPRWARTGRRGSVGAEASGGWPPPDVIRLWQWDLDAPGAGDEADRAILSPEERARADRFVVPHGARRFTAGRARMRRILAAVVGMPADALLLSVGTNGKPLLHGAPEFNLSHSGAVALFALAAFPVGVDIERIRPVDRGVAELVFSASELEEWGAAGRHEAIFYRGWTRKEAVLKARGGTLAEMKSLSVSLGNAGFLKGEPAWHIADVPAPQDYAAALAAPCGGWRVVCEASAIR